MTARTTTSMTPGAAKTTMASRNLQHEPPTKLSSSDRSCGNKNHRTPYLQKVEEALSRWFSQMEPYDRDAYIQTRTMMGVGGGGRSCNNSSKNCGQQQRQRLPFYPHVELGTAPIQVERIEDLQKIRPFGVHRNNRNNNGSSNSQKTSHVNGIGKSASSGPSKTTTPASSSPTPRLRESCFIESTSNSVRVSFLFKAQANAMANAATATGDPLEASILFQWMRFLMVQEDHPLLRKKPMQGYSVSFLVTNKHLAMYGLPRVTESILDFCATIDKECSDIKLQVNAQARYITTEFLKAFNQSSAGTTESQC